MFISSFSSSFSVSSQRTEPNISAISHIAERNNILNITQCEVGTILEECSEEENEEDETLEETAFVADNVQEQEEANDDRDPLRLNDEDFGLDTPSLALSSEVSSEVSRRSSRRLSKSAIVAGVRKLNISDPRMSKTFYF